MRWWTIASLLLLASCASQRDITITTNPPDALVSIDGQPPLSTPVTNRFSFSMFGKGEHQVTATRSGYQDSSITLTRESKEPTVEIDLKPFTRRLSFSILPVPGIVSVNGTPLSPDQVGQVSAELPFTKDSHDNWTHYKIKAERVGFEPAELTVTYTDPSADYVLQMSPHKKDVTINTVPAGASVSLDGDDIGASPTVARGLVFTYDVVKSQYIDHHLRIIKPGYDPYDMMLSWDGGQSEYHVDLPPRRKTARIITTPPGASVMIDGKSVAAGDDGNTSVDLTYLPTNDNGDMPTFTATISKKTADADYETTTVPLGWDDGKTDYSVTLKEIKTRPISLMTIALERDPDGTWEIMPRESMVLGAKDVNEAPGKEPASLLYQAPRGQTIDSLAVSPTGSLVLFTVISGSTRNDIRSQIEAVSSDGGGGVQQITDGKALDLMPSFTPDGGQIVFSSNRAGRRLNIWRKTLNGGAGIEQLTNSQEQDLWPTLDALPHPRLFYEGLSDTQADPQLFVAPLDSGSRMDLPTIPVAEPRVGPKADSVIFTSINQRTGNREIYRIPDRGGPPVNLTNDPDCDCYDPAWSKDGSLIAYVCDRGMDEDHRRNADIWVLDLSHPDRPIQVTTNGSVDDRPQWDPSGNAIYFRSNRGGQWGIWKVAVR